MRGVILAGGLGTRLYPNTLVQNKHLLPVYDRPMIYYPIQTLVNAGIHEIMLIVSGPFAGNFMPLLKNGEDLGCEITYAYQSKADGGIADALALAEDFIGNGTCCVILGDNTTDADLSKEVQNFDKSVKHLKVTRQYNPMAHLFLKEVDDPKSFGVAELIGDKIYSIEEKPDNPRSNLAVTGVYLYDSHVFSFVKRCQPSGRGQLEISDVNNMYLKSGSVTWSHLEGFWKDAGTFKNLVEANKYWASK